MAAIGQLWMFYQGQYIFYDGLPTGTEEEHLAVAKLLIDKGASLHTRLNTGETILHGAAFFGFPRLVDLLVERGLKVNTRDRKGRTPLHLAASSWHCSDENMTATFKTLLRLGANPHMTDEAGATPLHWTLARGRPLATRVLLKHGARVTKRDNKGYSALAWLASRDQPAQEETRKTRLDQKPDFVATLDLLKKSVTPTPEFHRAASQALKIARARCDVLIYEHIASLMGTPLTGVKELASECLEEPGKAQGVAVWIQNAVKEDDLNPLMIWLRAGNHIDQAIDRQNRLIHYAAFQGRTGMVRYLAEQGARLDIENERGTTPLMGAIQAGRAQVVQLLLDLGVKIPEDSYCLFAAIGARHNQLAITRMLLDHGANLHLKTKELRTPLHEAVRRGNLEVTRLLLKRGSDPDAMDIYRRTPRGMISRRGMKELFLAYPQKKKPRKPKPTHPSGKPIAQSGFKFDQPSVLLDALCGVALFALAALMVVVRWGRLGISLVQWLFVALGRFLLSLLKQLRTLPANRFLWILLLFGVLVTLEWIRLLSRPEGQLFKQIGSFLLGVGS
jgi:ankyrin repeat protein